MGIEVGEYVRSISGEIDKVDALYGMIENTIHLEKHKWQNIKNIKKHSKHIINLIEKRRLCEWKQSIRSERYNCLYTRRRF